MRGSSRDEDTTCHGTAKARLSAFVNRLVLNTKLRRHPQGNRITVEWENNVVRWAFWTCNFVVVNKTETTWTGRVKEDRQITSKPAAGSQM